LATTRQVLVILLPAILTVLALMALVLGLLSGGKGWTWGAVGLLAVSLTLSVYRHVRRLWLGIKGRPQS
jgi:hypothetical protein